MCKSKAEGGQRCDSKVAQMVHAVRAKVAAGEMTAPAPVPVRDRGVVHPSVISTLNAHWPGAPVDPDIRRDIVTSHGQVLRFDPARHEAVEVPASEVDGDPTRMGVVTAINKDTGEYVTYRVRETDGVWQMLGEKPKPLDAGAQVAPKPVIPAGFSTRAHVPTEPEAPKPRRVHDTPMEYRTR